MKMDRQFGMNRRAFLGGSTGALGMMALSQLLGGETARTHHRARAKSVICLFQHGGPSQVDLFDPKPELNRWHGKKYDGVNIIMIWGYTSFFLPLTFIRKSCLPEPTAWFV